MKTRTTAAVPSACLPVGDSESYRLDRRSAGIVIAFSASLLLLALGEGTRTLTAHEVVFTQPAKEMLATGNWILPKIAGIPSTHKPPGAHWMIALTMWLTGSEAAGVVRIPSALSGVATALLVAMLTARWFGRRIGLVAGLIQATTYYVLQLARLAECDMLMTLTVVGAMGSFAVANIDSPGGRAAGRWWPWVFYACVTLAYFFKGLIGPAFILSGCGAYVLVQRDWRSLRFLLNVPGMALVLLCTLGWFAAAYQQYPQILADQMAHHVGRFEGNLGGRKDPFFYAYSALMITLPWAPLVVGGVVRGLRRGDYSLPWWRFAACWVIPGMVLLNFSAFKSRHYAAPLMPPMTAVAALSLVAWMRARQQASGRSQAMWAGLGVAACAVGATLIGFLAPMPKGEKLILLCLAVLAAAALVGVAYCQYRHWHEAGLGVTFAALWLVCCGALTFAMPYHDSYRPQTDFAGQVNQLVPSGTPLDLVALPAGGLGNGENQIIYYLQPPLRRYDDVAGYGGAARAEASARYVLASVAIRDQLAAIGDVEELAVGARRPRGPAEDQMALYKLACRPAMADAPRPPPQ